MVTLFRYFVSLKAPSPISVNPAKETVSRLDFWNNSAGNAVVAVPSASISSRSPSRFISRFVSLVILFNVARSSWVTFPDSITRDVTPSAVIFAFSTTFARVSPPRDSPPFTFAVI